MKRTMALLMVLVMLFSCVGAASAYLDDHDHSFDTCVDVGRPATCTEGGDGWWACSVCGMIEYMTTAPLGHQWSEPEVMYTPAAGWVSQSYCYNCGTVNVLPAEPPMDADGSEDEAWSGSADIRPGLSITADSVSSEPVLEGTLVQFVVTVFNTGDVPLENVTVSCAEHGVRSVYGMTLDPGETVTFANIFCRADAEHTEQNRTYYTFRADGLTREGIRASSDSVVCYTDCAAVLPDSVQEPELVLTVVPAGTLKPVYVPGDTIDYIWFVANNGDQDCRLVELDRRSEIIGLGADELDVMVPAHGQVQGTGTLYVAEYNTAKTDRANFYFIAAGIGAEDEKVYASNEVMLSVITQAPELDTWIPPTVSEEVSVTFGKTVMSTPADPAGYRLGDTVVYRLTLENTDSRTLTAEVSDPMTALQETVTLAPGEVWTADRMHGVTVADAANGMILNQASAVIFDGETGKELRTLHASALVQAVQAASEASALSVKIAVNNEPGSPEGFGEAEQVELVVTVTNTGNLTLNDLYVRDDYYGTDLISGGTLLPGDSVGQVFIVPVRPVDLAGFSMTVGVTAVARPEGEHYCVMDQAAAYIPIHHSEAGMYALKTSEAPVGGEYFTVGETVYFTIGVFNDGDQPLSNICITDPMAEGPLYIDSLQPGEHAFVQVSHTVTQYDAAAGMISNSALVTAEDPLGRTAASWTNEVNVKTAAAACGVLLLEETVSSVPENGLYYTQGETITFLVHAECIQGTVKNVTFLHQVNAESMTELASGVDASVSGGYTQTVSYAVTAEDAARGYVRGQFYAMAMDGGCIGASDPVLCPAGCFPFGVEEPESPEQPAPDGWGYGFVIVPGTEGTPVPGDTDGDAPVPGGYTVEGMPVPGGYVVEGMPVPGGYVVEGMPVPGGTDDSVPGGIGDDLYITKVEISGPAEGYYQENDVIIFRITVINDSEFDIDQIDVWDEFNGTSSVMLGTDMTIAAHDFAYIELPYTVTAEDVARGEVTDIARLCYADGYRDSGLVIVPVGKPAPAAVMVDGDGSCCSLVLTGLGTASAEFEQHFCPAHLAAWKEASEAQTAAEVRQAWEPAIDALYDAIQAAAGRSEALVLQERAQFSIMTQAYEAMLTAAGESEQAIAQKLNLLLYTHCAELCSAAAAPAARTDSYLTDCARLTDAPAETAGIVITGTAEDGFSYKRVLDARLAVGETALQQQVASANTAAAMMGIIRLRQGDLDRAANALYLACDASARPAVVADRQAFGTWAKTHISFLQLLYGEDSPAPYELTASAVLNRVISLG